MSHGYVAEALGRFVVLAASLLFLAGEEVAADVSMGGDAQFLAGLIGVCVHYCQLTQHDARSI